MTERGLILRIIPYRDKAVVIHCLTQEHGVHSIFLKWSSKRPVSGNIQTGRYIRFKALKSAKGGLSLSEYSADNAMPLQPLKTLHTPVWLFTIEILYKALQEEQHIPGLREAIDVYYVNLLHDSISSSPLTPLIIVLKLLGMLRFDGLTLSEKSAEAQDLIKLGYNPKVEASNALSSEELFKILLSRYMKQYGVKTIHSLDIL